MVSRRRNTPELAAAQAAFADLNPDLRAVYERLHRRELAYRDELFGRYPTFLLNEIADACGSKVPTASIRRWIRDRRCFAYRHERRFRFPAFQFANGTPKPVVARVIGLLSPLEGWVVMYWFVAGNARLNDEVSPVAILDTDRTQFWSRLRMPTI